MSLRPPTVPSTSGNSRAPRAARRRQEHPAAPPPRPEAAPRARRARSRTRTGRGPGSPSRSPRPLGGRGAVRTSGCSGAQPPRWGRAELGRIRWPRDPGDGEAGRRAGQCHLTAPARPTLPAPRPSALTHGRADPGPSRQGHLKSSVQAGAVQHLATLGGRRSPRRVAEAACRPGRGAGGPRAMGGRSPGSDCGRGRSAEAAGARAPEAACRCGSGRPMRRRPGSPRCGPAGRGCGGGGGVRSPAGSRRAVDGGWQEPGMLSSTKGFGGGEGDGVGLLRGRAVRIDA